MGEALTALEPRAQAGSFRFLSVTRDFAREEAHHFAEVDVMQHLVEGQKQHDREARLFEEGRLQDAHVEVDRLRKEKTKEKKKKKKKKRNRVRILRDELRAEQHWAAAEELVVRLEARPERVEGVGEEEEEDEKTDWRGVAQLDLDDSDGEPLYEDPRQHAWSGLSQDLR